MIKMSTGARNLWLGAAGGDKSLKEIFAGGVLAIYGGNPGIFPATPEAAEVGTLLLLITLNGDAFTPGTPSTNGLTFSVSSAAKLSKPGGEVWKGTAVADGIPRYARLYDSTKTLGLQVTVNRMDLSVGYSSGVVRLSSMNTYVLGETEVVCTQFDFSVPDAMN